MAWGPTLSCLTPSLTRSKTLEGRRSGRFVLMSLALAYAQMIRAPHGLGYYGQLLAGLGWTSIYWLHRLRQPTLVLAGKDDPIVPPINARIMARLIPNATFQLFKGGHLFPLTEKE